MHYPPPSLVTLPPNPQHALSRPVLLLLTVQPDPDTPVCRTPARGDEGRLADMVREIRVTLCPPSLHERSELDDEIDQRQSFGTCRRCRRRQKEGKKVVHGRSDGCLSEGESGQSPCERVALPAQGRLGSRTYLRRDPPSSRQSLLVDSERRFLHERGVHICCSRSFRRRGRRLLRFRLYDASPVVRDDVDVAATLNSSSASSPRRLWPACKRTGSYGHGRDASPPQPSTTRPAPSRPASSQRPLPAIEHPVRRSSAAARAPAASRGRPRGSPGSAAGTVASAVARGGRKKSTCSEARCARDV